MRADLEKMEPQRVATAALQCFFNISERWGITDEQQRTLLGDPPESTFFEWKSTKSAEKLDSSVLVRISYIMGIYQALHTIYSDDAVGDGWLRRPNDNPLFEGHQPISRLTSGEVSDLQLIRQHLDSRLTDTVAYT
jgi:hypothetical protein